MNKESGIYIKNVMKGKYFLIDFISALLAFGILILVVLNSFGDGSGLYFVHIFTFGFLLSLLSCIKKTKVKSGFSIAFGFFSLLMAVMAVMCYFKL
ncbi:MAG: hypothetical protein K6E98_13275 [Lachnospiraceae bacterium]|nr:hypothetical protein [Lachnospiraceae bacterium]